MAGRPIDDPDLFPILRYLLDFTPASEATQDVMDEVSQIYADTAKRLAGCMGGGDSTDIAAGFRALRLAKDAHLAALRALDTEANQEDSSRNHS